MRPSIIFTIFKKETIEFLRDRRTIIISFVIPLILFPLVSTIVFSSTSVTEGKTRLSANTENGLVDYLCSINDIELIHDGKAGDLARNKADVHIDFPDNFKDDLSAKGQTEIKIYYNPENPKSITSLQNITTSIKAYANGKVLDRLDELNIPQYVLFPLSVSSVAITDEKSGTGRLVLLFMLPVMLTVFSVSCPMVSSCDSFAGEKERKTIEPLLSVGIPRTNILLGKFFSVSLVGFSGIMFFLIGIVVSYFINRRGFNQVSFDITSAMVTLLIVTTLFLAMMTSSVELIVSLIARSVKEAQSFIIPILMTGLALNYLGAKIEGETYGYSIPFVNIILLVRDIIRNEYSLSNAIIVYSWTIAYTTGFLLLGSRLIKKEWVIYRT